MAIIVSMARCAPSAAIGLGFSRARPCSSPALADRLQVIAGIEPLRDLADILAKRLAVAQERGASEHIDLSPASLT